MPETLRDIVDRLNRGAGDADGVARIAGALALMLVIGLAVEWLYGFALRRVRARLAQTAGDAYFARAFQLGASLALRLGALAVFALGAVAVYLTIRSIPDLWRIVLIAALMAIVAVRVTALLVRFLLSPASAGERLLPFDDLTARRLARATPSRRGAFRHRAGHAIGHGRGRHRRSGAGRHAHLAPGWSGSPSR